MDCKIVVTMSDDVPTEETIRKLLNKSKVMLKETLLV